MMDGARVMGELCAVNMGGGVEKAGLKELAQGATLCLENATLKSGGEALPRDTLLRVQDLASLETSFDAPHPGRRRRSPGAPRTPGASKDKAPPIPPSGSTRKDKAPPNTHSPRMPAFHHASPRMPRHATAATPRAKKGPPALPNSPAAREKAKALAVVAAAGPPPEGQPWPGKTAAPPAAETKTGSGRVGERRGTLADEVGLAATAAAAVASSMADEALGGGLSSKLEEDDDDDDDEVLNSPRGRARASSLVSGSQQELLRSCFEAYADDKSHIDADGLFGTLGMLGHNADPAEVRTIMCATIAVSRAHEWHGWDGRAGYCCAARCPTNWPCS